MKFLYYYNMYYDLSVSVKNDKTWTVMPYCTIYNKSTKTTETVYGTPEILTPIGRE